MEPFATVDDYEARYGDVEDADHISVLLADASAFVASQPGLVMLDADAPGYDLQQANLTRVTCAVVHRSLSAGDLAGLSSYSQGAVGYTASVSVANPGEDFYLTKADKTALGLGSGRIGQTWPYSVPRPEGE